MEPITALRENLLTQSRRTVAPNSAVAEWREKTPIPEAYQSRSTRSQVARPPVIAGVNYFEQGVTVGDMGIEGLSPQQVRELVE